MRITARIARRHIDAAVPAVTEPGPVLTPAGAFLGRWRPSRVAVGALLVGLVVTGALAWSSLAVYQRNEKRLLGLRVRELGLVLSGALPSVQTPLASAAALADATRGNPQKFRAFIAPYVGPGRQFASVSLWPVGRAHPASLVVVGSGPALALQPQQLQHFLARAERTPLLGVIGILRSGHPRLGYEFNSPGAKGGFAVYAESPLPENRRSRLASSSGFADLDYALYLGRSQRRQDLLVTNIQRLPISGRKASQLVRFGDSAFTLVVTPKTPLGGTFFADLPWAVAVLGVLLALAAALMTDRLARHRHQAERLAAVLESVARANRKLYTEQRSIAETLQHSLLPEALPEIGGLVASARYIPSASGIDVGGDWYDLVVTDDQRALLIVGDVSGHGLRVATTMASMRYAALAYVAEDHHPATVLAKLSDFVSAQDHGYFATVLCALIDVKTHRVSLASAGHIAPLLIDGDDGHFVDIRVGVPIGVAREEPYEEVTVSVLPKSTLLAFTDGLVERRGEVLDVGLERLRTAATADRLTLEDLVAKIADDLPSEDHQDDVAILGIRWLA